MASEGNEKLKLIQAIINKNTYYKKGKKALNIHIIIVFIIACASYYLNLYTVELKPDFHFFAAHEDLSFIELKKRSDAVHSFEQVSSWTEEALEDTFDFNYRNLTTQLNKKTNAYFSDTGRKSIIKALRNSGTLELIKNKKLIVTTKIEASSIELIDEGRNESGVYEWVINVPAIINYVESPIVSYPNKVNFKVYVTRRSMLEDTMGLSISRLLITIVR
tara:strand:+ start:2234 stop:2890 length:657 start_codon:yes stop_codon:yes gene_type:complete